MKKYIVWAAISILVSFGLGILGAEIQLRYLNPEKVVLKTAENSVVNEELPKTKNESEKIPESNSAVSLENNITEKTTDDGNASEPQKTEGFSFAVLGDTQYFDGGNYNGSFQKAVRNIKKSNVSFVFSSGDLVGNCDGNSECEGRYNSWKGALGQLMEKTYAVQGNHDRAGREKADNVWQKVFNFPTNGPEGYKEFTYSFDYNNSHFVFLDSDKPKENVINSTQRSWLEQDLAANKKENTFVFFHEPAYPVSSKISESLDANSSERNSLWDILVQHKVTAVFSGHEHIFSRKNINGIYQFVVGDTDSFNHEAPKAGMAQYSYVGHHYAIVTVVGKKITVNLYTVDGNLLNSFDFQK